MKLITKERLLQSRFRSDYDTTFVGCVCLFVIAVLVFFCIAILAGLETANNITMGGLAAAVWALIIFVVGICLCAYGAVANFIEVD